MNKTLGDLSKRTTIKNKNVLTVENGYFNDLFTFFNEYIKPRMLDKDIVIGWHKMLMEYVEMNNNTLFLRAGNTSGKLRRGWMTRYVYGDKSFNVVFTDNDLGCIVYKMALDKYIPLASEFYHFLTTFDTWDNISFSWESNKKPQNIFDYEHNLERKFLKFPVHFLQSGGKTYPDKYENEMNAALLNGKGCVIGKLGYKHSHIFNAGKDFYFNGKVLKMSDITKEYITINEGDETDYKWDSTINNYIRIIDIDGEEEFNNLKEIAIAATLRFIDPLNHFLSPKSKSNLYMDKDGNIHFDVAEYDVLTNYLANYISINYTEIDFDDFYKKALIKFDYVDESKKPFKVMFISKEETVEEEKINMKTNKTKASSKNEKTLSSKNKKKNTSSTTKGTRKKYNDDYYKVAAYYLRNNDGLIKVELKVLGILNGGGTTAKNILNKLGISTETNNRFKGLLITSDIDVEISKATGKFKETLEEIKKRKL